MADDARDDYMYVEGKTHTTASRVAREIKLSVEQMRDWYHVVVASYCMETKTASIAQVFRDIPKQLGEGHLYNRERGMVLY